MWGVWPAACFGLAAAGATSGFWPCAAIAEHDGKSNLAAAIALAFLLVFFGTLPFMLGPRLFADVPPVRASAPAP